MTPNPLTMSADEILLIKPENPELLFSGPHNLAAEKKALAKKWHPDLNGDANSGAVFKHINMLFGAAKIKAENGVWDVPNQLILQKKATNAKVVIRYQRRVPFELGEMFYGRTKVLFLINPGFKDMFEAGERAISDLGYGSPRMEAEMKRFLPDHRTSFEVSDGRLAYLMNKSGDVFLLKDIQAALGGLVHARHVAWILNATYNLACYLEHRGLTHNAISTETVFISPEHHSALLLGGWWYSCRKGQKLLALPAYTHRNAPADVLREKKADYRLDLLLIKTMGRELLGDVTGMTLAQCGAPDPMVQFLRSPSTGSARQDYRAWGSVVDASFGKRTFTEMAITENEIFKL